MLPDLQMFYSEAIQFLHSLGLFGARFGLENSFKLAALADNPQEKLRFIHVAGTNGKGSTCAMLESVYRAAGLRVGLFTSPHLVAFGERIQINRQLIPEPDVARLVDDIKPLLQTFPSDSPPTFFEVVTNMALRYFAEQRCDLVIWETGLGGRLDATNIVTPIANVITNIDYDHEQWLGDTLEKIAFEKAGIIKPGVPVITSAAAGKGLEVIAETAQQRRAPLTTVSWDAGNRPPLDTIRLPLLGQHQKANAALAIATARSLAAQIPVSDEAIRTGLSTVHWPGRMQLMKRSTGQTILLDGAHNKSGSEALIETLRQEFPDVKPTIIFGVLRDKDWTAMAATLAKHAARLVLTPVSSERTLRPEELLSACQAANPITPVTVSPSLAAALQETASDPFVVITGSLYLIGEAIELLQLSPAPPQTERGLNEWSAQPRRVASSEKK